MKHLTEDQLAIFRERLEAARLQIETLLERTVEDTRPVDLDLPIGRLSRIDAIQMQGMAQKNRQQLDIRRQQVEASLASFEQGTYGLCRSCREPIAFGRLDVLPETPFCLSCQDMFERERS